MSVGALRTSQIVTTFGPGAMVDLPDASVIISGLGDWQYDRQTLEQMRIHEPRLEMLVREALKKQEVYLRLPHHLRQPYRRRPKQKH